MKTDTLIGHSPQVVPHFTTKNANLRGSKEKIVYLRERKALKTIGIVVLGKETENLNTICDFTK